jgi:sialate O-acetylesterase
MASLFTRNGFKLFTLIAIIAVFAAAPEKVMGEVTLPNVLSSNMVLQRGGTTTIWGWAQPGEKIRVTFRGNNYQVKTDKKGNWKTAVTTGEAGGPFVLTIEGKNKIQLDNILVGDVWVCSGQSNMEWPLRQTDGGELEATKANFLNIRLFQVANNAALAPVDDVAKTTWVECTPATAIDFSAVGYYFGKEIHAQTSVPIGLISSNWGGTIVETWTSTEALENDPDFSTLISEMKNIDVETLAKNQKQTYENYRIVLDKVLKPDFDHPYIASDFDDSGWKEYDQPGLWELHDDFKAFDGIMWYRKEIFIPEGFNASGSTVSLARIDDSDIVWINGKRVGETFNKYNLLRSYKLSPGVLKTGKNVIVMRVEDYTGGGGFHGLASEMYLTDGVATIDLSGKWKLYQDELPTPANPENPNQSPLGPNLYPSLLFNGMIHPLLNYAIKGAIWYQGESNADDMIEALNYERYLTRMINDWRKKWGVGNFSFYQVQLANFRDETVVPGNDVWPYLREAQENVAKIEGVGMACIIDIGDAGDIHPRNKVDVGKRLALLALKNDYKKEVVVHGPRVEEVRFSGNKAIVTFNSNGDELVVKNKYGYINGFALAGSDKKFQYARAYLIGNNQVEVIANDIAEVLALRFLWSDNPGEINLYGKTGLPAQPFRTDDWNK